MDERLQLVPDVGLELAAAARRSTGEEEPSTAAKARKEARSPASRAGRLAALIARELDRGTAFHFVPVFLCAGALVYFAMPQEPGWGALGLAACFAAAGFRLVGLGSLWHLPFAATLVFLAGMAAAKHETWRAGTKMAGAEISTRLTADVVSVEHQASGRVRLTLDVRATERPQLRYAPDRVRASARSVPDGLKAGDVVVGIVRFLPASGPVRPHSYDFTFKSYFSGIGASGFYLSGPEIVQPGQPRPERWRDRMENWRMAMAERIATRIGGAEGAIAAALITGIRAGIPEEVNEALRVTGLYHVISISGLHMALVGGTVLVAVRFGFALVPSFSARRPVKKYAALVALAATAFYLVMSGSDVAAQRSFLMLAVMLIAVLFDRAALTMRNLAISAIVIVLATPHEVVGPSFQMSFAATAALIAAYAAWSEYSERRRAGRAIENETFSFRPMGWLGTGAKYAIGLSLTSVVAGGATALFTAWHFQQVAPLGLVANLTAMPFVSVIVMPMAVVASLLMPLGLDGPALDLMGFGIWAMNEIAFWLAERSAYDATGTIPLSAVLVLTAALTVLTMLGGPLRWAALPLIVAGIALLAGREIPHVLVSEDGRLVAMRLSDGTVAVNRPRPRAFTMQNWLRAFDAGEVVLPARGDPQTVLSGAAEQGGFVCGDGACAARHESGAVVFFAEDGEAAARACGVAALIVIDDATAQNPCAGDAARVITKRDLARRGSAEAMLRAADGGRPVQADLRFAVAEPYRAWHDHRRFSREARGLAPWEPRSAASARARGEGGEASSTDR